MLYDVRPPLPSAGAALIANDPVTQPESEARKVLIVEDDPLNQKLFRDLLCACGYDVLCASSGAEALDLCRVERLDLVLLDAQLPDMAGVDVARELARERRAPRILAISAFAGAAEAAQLRAAGCAGLLTKPVSINDLLGRIETESTGAAQ